MLYVSVWARRACDRNQFCKSTPHTILPCGRNGLPLNLSFELSAVPLGTACLLSISESILYAMSPALLLRASRQSPRYVDRPAIRFAARRSEMALSSYILYCIASSKMLRRARAPSCSSVHLLS